MLIAIIGCVYRLYANVVRPSDRLGSRRELNLRHTIWLLSHEEHKPAPTTPPFSGTAKEEEEAVCGLC